MTSVRNNEKAQEVFEKWSDTGSMQGRVGGVKAYLASSNECIALAIEKSEADSEARQELQELAEALQAAKLLADAAFARLGKKAEQLIVEYSNATAADEV